MRRRTFLFGLGAAACAASLESRTEPALGTIAYILNDGLWIKDLPDGSPRQLVAHTKLRYPKFSASGEWITYSTDPDCTHQYRVSRHGGSPVRIAKPDGRVFAADGSRYAYSRELARIDFDTPHNQLWISNGTGSPHLVLDDHATLYLWGWSRDNRSVIYWRDPIAKADIDDGLDLFVVPLDTGKPSPLGFCSLVEGDFVTLSPTPDLVAVTAGDRRETWTNKRITLANFQTGNHTPFTEEKLAALYPSWSPNGAEIAFCAEPDAEIVENDERLARGQRTYNVMAPNGETQTLPVTPQTRIGVADPLSYVKQRRIWTADVSNPSRRIRITDDPAYYDEKPMWSHDGAKILFCRVQSSDKRTLWLMSANGSEPLKLTPDLYFDPWSFHYGYNNWTSLFDWHQPLL